MSIRVITPNVRQLLKFTTSSAQRYASTATAASLSNDLEVSSLDTPSLPNASTSTFDPVAAAEAVRLKLPSRAFRHGSRKQLPPGRYKFRPPKYYRGPLHPHQPLPADDIASREFIPGPFIRPILQETYDSVLASDMLTLCYTHVIPGSKQKEPVDRMRPWVGDSPYFENRPPKGPRGRRDVLHPKHRPINFRNIPQLKKVTIHAHIPEATSNSAWLHTASIALQSITGVRATSHVAKKNIMDWGARKGRYVSLTMDLDGENMYNFLSTLIQVVMPRIKDWKGVSGGSGDSTGNISFGLSEEAVALFPEIEVNYDMYPQQMIPGCHITIQTSAVTDREARLLMTAIGIPFYGKLKKR